LTRETRIGDRLTVESSDRAADTISRWVALASSRGAATFALRRAATLRLDRRARRSCDCCGRRERFRSSTEMPLDGRAEAIVVGVAFPALVWLDRSILLQRPARAR